MYMQWPVTASSKLRVDYNEHQVKLTVSIEAAGAAGKTRKQRKNVMIQNHLIAWAVCWLVESTGCLGAGSGSGSGWNRVCLVDGTR